MQTINEYLTYTNNIMWTYIGIPMLVLAAIYFTIRMKGMQFRLLPDMFRIMVGLDNKRERKTKIIVHTSNGKKTISSFEAFAVALSSRVGTGNLAGVASAIYMGGPGAIFWMWIMALLGSATAYVESSLAQLYKRKGEDGYYGGPAYYMISGLGRRWMAMLFAFLIIITFGMANQTTQSNTLCDALSSAFSVEKWIVGIILTIATISIIYGGIHRISRFSSIVVPFMAIGYLIIAIIVIALNFRDIPNVFCDIFESAFGIRQAAGGMVGAAIMNGVKRGLFSNEAGEGSAPNAAAIAHTSHPAKQGLLQSLGVFTDTLVICTCTAFVILLSGLYDNGLDGILLTKQALVSELGPAGGWFLTAAIFLFAYSTIIANYFYGENNIRFLAPDSKKWLNVYRVAGCSTILAGGFITLQTAWGFVDIAMCMMTICNLAAVIQLSPKAFRLLTHYENEKRKGKNPVFRRKDLPETNNIECWE